MIRKLTVLLVLVLAACSGGSKGPFYEYKAAKDSGFISAYVLFEDSSTDSYKALEFPYQIDGLDVRASGSNVIESTQQVVPVAPGHHSVGIAVIGKRRVGTTHYGFDVVAGRRYAVRMEPIWTKGDFFSDTLDKAKVWIEDSKGKKLTEVRTIDLEDIEKNKQSQFMIIPGMKYKVK